MIPPQLEYLLSLHKHNQVSELHLLYLHQHANTRFNNDESIRQLVKHPQSIRSINAARELVQQSIKVATAIRENSCAKYSRFKVGAALHTDGGFVGGVNVESSSYGLTICAERSALVSALSIGLSNMGLCTVVTDTIKLTPPCGACRQLLHDYAHHDSLIVLANLRGETQLHLLSELLPHAFDDSILHS